MNKITCDICLDLIPLVNDNIASDESCRAVKEHVKVCKSCQQFYKDEEYQEIKMNDNLVISKIKKHLYFSAIAIIVFGAILGLALTDGVGLFYNILIMPTIGMIGYFTLYKKVYYVPPTLFTFIYLWLLIKYVIEGMFSHALFISAMIVPFYWALIYSGLCVLGIVIAFLLNIAFRKEVEDEKSN